MIKNYPPCGVYCKTCNQYKNRCLGCVETEGKPWFLRFAKREVCPVFECAMKHKVTHCGLCKEFPCNVFLSWYNPRVCK